MPIGRALDRALDRDRPLYALHATGIAGTEPPHERMEDALNGYLAEIRAVRPRGPYVLGGICAGSFVAMGLARALAEAGERVGAAILVDPPPVPFYQLPGHRDIDLKADRRVYQQLAGNVEQTFRLVARQFELPFDVSDPVQLQRAIEVGVTMAMNFGRYVPPPFDGPTEFIISDERAFSHFHPQGPWKSIVTRPGRFHVIPGRHSEFFYSNLDEILRLVQFALDSAF